MKDHEMKCADDLPSVPLPNQPELLALADAEARAASASRDADRAAWAAAQLCLARALREERIGNQVAHLERAIRILDEVALHGHPRDSEPVAHAQVQVELATCWFYLPGLHREHNLMMARRHLDQALRTYTEEAHTLAWADAQNRLGLILASLQRGPRAENLDAAIACLENAARAFWKGGDQRSARMVDRNLGVARRQRLLADAPPPTR